MPAIKSFKMGLGLGVFVLLAAEFITVISTAEAAPAFNSPAFSQLWNTLDKPVESLASSQVQRGYSWGPAVGNGLATTNELYDGKPRIVQYFDKARMELNADGSLVTTGLLVKELVTGLRQDGDNSFTRLQPSQVQIAGDPNLNGTNPNAPTYASFQNVVTFVGDEHGQPQVAPSTYITSQIDKTGKITTITPPAQVGYGGYDNITRHNIAAVFVAFANQSGLIYDGSSYVNRTPLLGNPTLVLGRAVTEPYWVHTLVAGKPQLVLVQLFERRVLTYTPSNPAPFHVEMGNVGQHYFIWRYLEHTSPDSSRAPADFSQYLAAYARFNSSVPQGGNANIQTHTPPAFKNDSGVMKAADLSDSPALSNDGSTLIVGSSSGLEALDSQTLSLKWRFPDQPTYFYTGDFSNPTVCGGVVITGNDEQTLYAFNLSNGILLWQHHIEIYEYINGAALCDGSQVYFSYTRSDNTATGQPGTAYLTALRLSDGSQSWQISKDHSGFIALLFGAGGNIYVATFTDGILAYTPTGQAISGWTVANVGDVSSRPAYANGKMYVVGNTQNTSDYATLYALDSSGNITDKFDLGGFAQNTPAVADGRVYVYARTYPLTSSPAYTRIYGLAVDNLAKVQFDLTISNGVSSELAVVNGYLYYNNSNGELHQIATANPNPGNDKILLTITAQYGPHYNPLLANNRLYIGGGDGKFYAIK